MKWTITPVDPIGTKDVYGIGCGLGKCRLMSLPVAEYRISPKAVQFKAARRASGLVVREAAKLVGMSATDLSGLEIGRNTMPDAEWDALIKLMPKREVPQCGES